MSTDNRKELFTKNNPASQTIIQYSEVKDVISMTGVNRNLSEVSNFIFHLNYVDEQYHQGLWFLFSLLEEQRNREKKLNEDSQKNPQNKEENDKEIADSYLVKKYFMKYTGTSSQILLSSFLGADYYKFNDLLSDLLIERYDDYHPYRRSSFLCRYSLNLAEIINSNIPTHHLVTGFFSNRERQEFVTKTHDNLSKFIDYLNARKVTAPFNLLSAMVDSIREQDEFYHIGMIMLSVILLTTAITLYALSAKTPANLLTTLSLFTILCKHIPNILRTGNDRSLYYQCKSLATPENTKAPLSSLLNYLGFLKNPGASVQIPSAATNATEETSLLRQSH